MTSLRQAAQQALEALNADDSKLWPSDKRTAAISTLRAALEEPTIKNSLTTGSCIACGNRMTGSPESFVVATAEVGATAPEGYSPQQVEALHPHKGGDKTSPPLVDRIADCLVEDHIALMRENERLRAALAEPVEAVAIVGTREGTWKGYEGQWLPPGPPIKTVHMLRDLPQGTPLYTTPPQRKPLSGLEVERLLEQVIGSLPAARRLVRAVEKAHGIGGSNDAT